MPPQPTIAHFDFANIRYSSFYRSGFAHNAPLYGYRLKLSRRPPAFLTESRMSEDWRKQMSGPLLFRFMSGSEDYYFCIDVGDHDLGLHLPALQRVKFYFKVNYNPDCFMRDPTLLAHAHKIHPILPFFPLRSTKSLGQAPRLLPCRPMAWSFRSVLRRTIDTPRIPTMGTVKRLRGGSKSCDVFFLTTYYPGQLHEAAMEFRYKLMEELDRQHFARSVYGFASRKELPEPFSRYCVNRLSLSEYLRGLASSRVAIYVRGLWECISFKFGQYLALGLPIVGQTILNNRESLVSLPYFDEQFAFDDPRDIVLQAAAMLRHSDKRSLLGESNAYVFDRMLSPESVVANALDCLGVRRHGA